MKTETNIKLYTLQIVIALLAICFTNYSQTTKVKIGLLSSEELSSNELKSTEEYLANNENIEYDKISFEDIVDGISLSEYDVLWFHRPDSSEFNSVETNPEAISAIKNYVSEGGGLLLTLDAFKYIVNLGLESNAPEVRYKLCEDQGFGRLLGFHSFRSHPIFKGLNGGSYIYKPRVDIKVRQLGYFDDNIPKEGKVVAVDWDYIFLREHKKVVVEYTLGEGKILAVGGYTYFEPENINRQHLELFTQNTFNYLTNKITDVEKFHWNFDENKVIPFESELGDIQYTEAVDWNDNTESMTLTADFAQNNYYDIAGERMLIMGKEPGGIDELWAHPFMALRDYEVGIQFSYKDSIYWFNEQRPRIEVKPESFTRVYKFPRAYVTEVITTDITQPVSVLHYEYRGVYPAKLYVKFKSNFRYMWPYSEKAIGSLYISHDNAANAIIIKDKSEDFNCIVGSDHDIKNSIIGRFSDFVKEDSLMKGVTTDEFFASSLLEFDLRMNDNMDIVITATSQGFEESVQVYKEAVKNTEAVYNKTTEYTRGLFDKYSTITTPDENYNTGYKWALVGTDRFLVNTPGLGKSLVAGYSTTARGWGGGHKVSGRPGYAWYFGRDSEWSGMALLDYGDFQKVKQVLVFLQNYQDLNGKIFHEHSTSGFIHYDASDATPLYLVLAGKYLRHSGDVEFIKESWSHIKAAIDFCFSTDTDGDHLIENTNVGHGWVEGGELFGSHSSLYLTACWAKALAEAAYMAEAIDKDEEASYYKEESNVVKNILNTDFWNEEINFFYHGLFIDGTYHEEPTALPAVPIYFNLVNEDKINPIVKTYSGYEYTADWGVRIVSRYSPFFKPYGYHNGSIWPLFTGWVSLAEFNNGYPFQGFSHVYSSLNVYKYWSLGFVEEVLQGLEYKPTGVCPHQCWSETMVLQPSIEGMLGLKVDALNKQVTFAPRLPADWNSILVDNIKIAENTIQVKMERNENKTTYYFTLKGNDELKTKFNPMFPSGTKFAKVVINGNESNYQVKKLTQAEELQTEFVMEDEVTVEVDHEGGISVLPVIPNEKPGYKTSGMRILKAELNGNQYNINLQGKGGKTEIVKVYSNEKINEVVNGNIVRSDNNNVYWVEVSFDDSTEEYLEKQIKIILGE